jgi:8-oxo-dGTP diphosphatase
MKQVAAAIIFYGEKILVTRRAPGEKLAGYWEFPGGKIKASETPQGCIVRELFEELGVHAMAGEIIARSIYEYPEGVIELIAIECKVKELQINLTVHDSYEFLQPDELLGIKLAPADIEIAEEVIRRHAEN